MRCPLIIGLLLLASTDAAMPADLSRQASIIDGETLEIHGARIRLSGIDAPESTQLCRGEDSLQYRCGAKYGLLNPAVQSSFN
jgi:endonuclease YncB( thermonuclease family)